MRTASGAQGSLEILLLTGGAVVVAALTIALLMLVLESGDSSASGLSASYFCKQKAATNPQGICSATVELGGITYSCSNYYPECTTEPGTDTCGNSQCDYSGDYDNGCSAECNYSCGNFTCDDPADFANGCAAECEPSTCGNFACNTPGDYDNGCPDECMAGTCGNDMCDSEDYDFFEPDCPTECAGQFGVTCGNNFCDEYDEYYGCEEECYPPNPFIPLIDAKCNASWESYHPVAGFECMHLGGSGVADLRLVAVDAIYRCYGQNPNCSGFDLGVPPDYSEYVQAATLECISQAYAEGAPNCYDTATGPRIVTAVTYVFQCYPASYAGSIMGCGVNQIADNFGEWQQATQECNAQAASDGICDDKSVTTGANYYLCSGTYPNCFASLD